MVALNKPLVTTDYPDTGMPLITPGQYPAVIIGGELKDTKNKDGQFIALKIVLTGGPHANTEFTERLNIINKNQQAVDIAYKTLARITEAVGLSKITNTDELNNRPFFVEIKTEKGKEYTDKDGVKRQGYDQSVIGRYLPVPALSESDIPFPPVQDKPAAAPVNNPFAVPKS